MKPTYFIDLETSGIAPESYPIEVDVVFSGGEYQALIQPASYWDHWSYDAQDMHGLSQEQLIGEGLSPLEVAKAVSRLFDGKSCAAKTQPTAIGWTCCTKLRVLSQLSVSAPLRHSLGGSRLPRPLLCVQPFATMPWAMLEP